MRFKKTHDPREFWEQVAPDGCWEWQGGRDQDGYGQTRNGQERVKAHRKAWTLLMGPIPENMLVLHSCDNPPCVRPDHLFLGTHTDNQQDKWAKGRGGHGVRNGSSKVTDAQVRAIRARYATGTVRQADLARETGLNQTTISAIVNRKTWKHI